MAELAIFAGREKREVAARNPVEDWVEVRYDPKKSGRAILHLGGTGWLLASLVLISAVGPILALAFTRRRTEFPWSNRDPIN